MAAIANGMVTLLEALVVQVLRSHPVNNRTGQRGVTSKSNATTAINTNAQRPAAQPAQPQKFVIVTQRPATPQPTTPTTVLPTGLSGAIKYPNPTTINTINLPQNIQVQKVQQNPKIVIVNPPSNQQQAQQSLALTPTAGLRPIFVGQDVSPPELDDLSHLA